MKICTKCKTSKDLTDFYKNINTKDGYHQHCKKCITEGMKASYKKNPEPTRIRNEAFKLKVVNAVNKIKSDAGCKFCPEKEIVCLEFHHLDPALKENHVSDLVRHKNLPKALEEIKKCIVVCSNCHRKIHAGIIQFASEATKERAADF